MTEKSKTTEKLKPKTKPESEEKKETKIPSDKEQIQEYVNKLKNEIANTRLAIQQNEEMLAENKKALNINIGALEAADQILNLLNRKKE